MGKKNLEYKKLNIENPGKRKGSFVKSRQETTTAKKGKSMAKPAYNVLYWYLSIWRGGGWGFEVKLFLGT